MFKTRPLGLHQPNLQEGRKSEGFAFYGFSRTTHAFDDGSQADYAQPREASRDGLALGGVTLVMRVPSDIRAKFESLIWMLNKRKC